MSLLCETRINRRFQFEHSEHQTSIPTTFGSVDNIIVLMRTVRQIASTLWITQWTSETPLLNRYPNKLIILSKVNLIDAV